MDRIKLVREAKMLSIVIPTYNEKDNIAPLLERIHGALPGIEHEVIFVDDSKDETPAVIEEIAKSDSTVVLHHRENEKGLATAVVKGFSLAKGDFVACMDADLQHPPEVLLDMHTAMLAGADMSIPSRFILGGSDGGLNLWRKFVSGNTRGRSSVLRSVREVLRLGRGWMTCGITGSWRSLVVAMLSASVICRWLRICFSQNSCPRTKRKSVRKASSSAWNG
jgi:glycosyltransferase involved in cell wall biosynthesis